MEKCHIREMASGKLFYLVPFKKELYLFDGISFRMAVGSCQNIALVDQ